MMQNIKILLPFLLMMAACTGPKYLSSKKVKASAITSLEFLRPVTPVIWVKQKNDGDFNDSLSLRAEATIRESLFKLQDKLPTLHPVVITDTAVHITVCKEIITACRTSSAYNSIHVLPLPPSVDKFLELNGKRFGILVFYSGYKRSMESYNWVKRKTGINNMLNILTLPGVGGLPFVPVQITNAYKSEMALDVMIVDAFENKIIFFNESFIKDKDPADPAVVTNELSKMLLGYFK